MNEKRFSARKALSMGFVTMVLMGGGLVGWSVFASLSGAVIASGRLGVESHNQVVEHIDGGTVSRIFVRDGDSVKKNDVLLRFDTSLLRSEEAILASEYAELVARRNRLEAELKGVDEIAWREDIAALAVSDARVRELLDGHERLFRARMASRDGEVAQLRERIGQARKQILGLEARAFSLEEQRELIFRQLEAYRDLFDNGLTSLDRLLALERAAKNIEGLVGTNDASIAGVRGRISELQIQILRVDARRIEEAEQQVREAKARENQIYERLALVRERLRRAEVRAPVSGKVFGMKVVAPREVVRPGEPILYIVPEDSGLVVMARLNPIHVDQVYPGQEARLRFSSFPARVTSEFPGHVIRVSADAVFDPRSGLSWYEIDLAMGEPNPNGTSGPAAKTDDSPGSFGDFIRWLTGTASREIGDSTNAIKKQNISDALLRELPLTPGMPVEVHIQTGQRSLISYLAKPLTDFFSRSMKEE